jgi:hypothetical protein
MSDRCIVSGCEIIPETKARKIWEEAEKRGVPNEIFHGKCLAHCRDAVARAKLERIQIGKAEAKKFAEEEIKKKGYIYGDGEVTVKRAALLMATSSSMVGSLIELGFLEFRVLGPHHRAVKVESIRDFVEMLETTGGFLSDSRFRLIPVRILDQMYDAIPDIKANLDDYDHRIVISGAPDQ